MNNTIYLTGKEDHNLAKSKIVVGKIVCSDLASGSGGGRLAVQ